MESNWVPCKLPVVTGGFVSKAVTIPSEPMRERDVHGSTDRRLPTDFNTASNVFKVGLPFGDKNR